jgi:hypothetical protein
VSTLTITSEPKDWRGAVEVRLWHLRRGGLPQASLPDLCCWR